MPRLQTDYKTMYCQILFILSSIGTTFSDFLLVTESCKYWDYLKVYGNGGSKHLHCILDQDFQPGLVYTDVKIIEGGKCPIYNRYAKQIDSIPCTKSAGECPQEPIRSYQGVTYYGCYDAITKHTNVISPARTEDESSPQNVSIKHSSVTIPTRTKDGSPPPTVPIKHTTEVPNKKRDTGDDHQCNSHLRALLAMTIALAVSLCLIVIFFVQHYRIFRQKSYRGAKDRPLTKEEIKAMITSDTQQKFLTKEEMQEIMANSAKDRPLTKEEIKAMIISDTQQNFLTKEEMQEMVAYRLLKDKEKAQSSIRSYDTGVESD